MHKFIALLALSLTFMTSPILAQTFEVDSNVFTGPVTAEVQSGWNDTDEWALSGFAQPSVILNCPQGVVEGAMVARIQWTATPVHASVSDAWGVEWVIRFEINEEAPELDRLCAEQAQSVLEDREEFFEVKGGRAHQSIVTDYGQHDWWADLPVL